MTHVFPLTPVPDDLADRTEYVEMVIPLYALYRQMAAKGAHVIEGKTFTRCRIDGPAVLLALAGNQFDGCYFGDDEGDPRNLLLRPVGPEKVTGAIPVARCVFDACNFFSMGYTGTDAFLDDLQKAIAAKEGRDA